MYEMKQFAFAHYRTVFIEVLRKSTQNSCSEQPVSSVNFKAGTPQIRSNKNLSSNQLYFIIVNYFFRRPRSSVTKKRVSVVQNYVS
jgi:hypothetical protein